MIFLYEEMSQKFDTNHNIWCVANIYLQLILKICQMGYNDKDD